MDERRDIDTWGDFRAKLIMEAVRRVEDRHEKIVSEIGALRSQLVTQEKYEAMDQRLRVAEQAVARLWVMSSVIGGAAGLLFGPLLSFLLRAVTK